jgi:Holliday junction DNA helicase RuvA
LISQIAGEVQSIGENTVTVDVSGISYDVFIPTAILRSLESKLVKNGPIALITYHYYQTDPSKSIPILIGFANRMEKEFFEKFITVSGVGPKAAVRALSQPIPDIAEAIDGADLAYLKSLPGIGEQRAKEIIAKLQGKMARFGLMKQVALGPATGARKASVETDGVQDEAVDILLQLQYKKDEAREMVRKAFLRNPKLSSSEEVLNEVYRQSKEKIVSDGRQ